MKETRKPVYRYISNTNIFVLVNIHFPEGARFVRGLKEDEKVGGVVAQSKQSLTENDEYDENEENDEYYENDNTQNDEPEGYYVLLINLVP